MLLPDGMMGFVTSKADEYEEGLKYLQWSCQYLLKTIIGSAAKPLGIKLIWQVCAKQGGIS